MISGGYDCQSYQDIQLCTPITGGNRTPDNDYKYEQTIPNVQVLPVTGISWWLVFSVVISILVFTISCILLHFYDSYTGGKK
jgi:hypothetical protein